MQVLEPALCLFDAGTFRGLYESTYATLSKSVAINLVTFYDDVGDCFAWVSKLPVKAISFDFCGVVRFVFPRLLLLGCAGMHALLKCMRD